MEPPTLGNQMPMAGEKTGGKYDSQIQAGEQKVEDYLGVQDQDNQDNQGQ
jgi:hypothetical protein